MRIQFGHLGIDRYRNLTEPQKALLKSLIEDKYSEPGQYYEIATSGGSNYYDFFMRNDDTIVNEDKILEALNHIKPGLAVK